MNLESKLRKLFPQQTASFDGRGGSEVNGLPKNTIPENCEILLSGLKNSKILNRQEHYLVQVDETMIYLRVCSAYEGSGYDEFAVIRDSAETSEEKEALLDYARRSIEAICGEVKEGDPRTGYSASNDFGM